MTTAAPAAAPRRTSTAGAWLGLGIAARAGFTVVYLAINLAAIELAPFVVDWVSRNAEREAARNGINAQELPALQKLFELGTDAAALVRPYHVVIGGSGIVLGLVTLVAAFGLMRGSDFFRKVCRGLLLLDLVHTLIGAAWTVVLSVTRFDDLFARYLAVVNELSESLAGRNGPKSFPLTEMHGIGIVSAVSAVAGAALSLAVAGVLFWLAGRPFAREWCAARSRK